MTIALPSLRTFLTQPAALIEIITARGSTPREAGAWMLVSTDAIWRTIGGGQLEYMAIDKARQMLAAGAGRSGGNMPPIAHLSIPLGPEIGQCCGGRVDLSIEIVDAQIAQRLIAAVEAEQAALPHAYLFGGGHVGHALAAAMALLPVRAIVVETREAELRGLPDNVEARLVAMPEQAVRDAPVGSAFLILTHDHALDFLIAAEALKRSDAAYIGMIGSRTKRATFNSWHLKNAGGSEADLARLVCPIGGEAVKDKRPAVIAALAAAEVMTALALHEIGTCCRVVGEP